MDLLCDISQYIWKRGRHHWHTVIYIFLNPYRTNDKWSYNKPCMLYILWHCSIHMEKEGEFIETQLYTNMQNFLNHTRTGTNEDTTNCVCYISTSTRYRTLSLQTVTFRKNYCPAVTFLDTHGKWGRIHWDTVIYIYTFFFLIHNRTETIGITTTEIHNSTF